MSEQHCIALASSFAPSSVLADTVLREVAELIGALAADAAFVQAIDLHALPLDEHGRAQLRARLGRGELVVFGGPDQAMRIWETAYAGVWWLQYTAPGNALLLEQIVVARVPEIVAAHPADVAAAARRLAREIDPAAQAIEGADA